jgi:alanine racemase
MQITAPVTMVKRVPPHTAIGYGKTYETTSWSTVATLGIGYADGYRRAFSNRASVLLHGRRCLVAGRVSMDQTTLVVPDDVAVSVGDSVVLLGSDGDDQITADDWAQWADTISYEIFTGISGRIPRRYIENVDKGKISGPMEL